MARWHSRSTMRRPNPAYWWRTAARVARRMAALALPVITSDSQAAGGACLRPGGDDLDLIPIDELRYERSYLAVNLAAHRHVPHPGMDGIGEVYRIRAPWQGDQLALGREAKDLVVKEFELGVFEELLRIGALREQFDGAAKPCIGARFACQFLCRRAEAVFIEGVCSDAVLSDLIHVESSDLQLHALLAGTDHGGVDRAVVVLLGRRDVILEPARHYRPGGVDNPSAW